MSEQATRQRSRARKDRAAAIGSRQVQVGKHITFLLSDVQDSVHLWEQDAEAMRRALARHDRVIEESVQRYGGVLVRPRGEGDSRFAVFDHTPSGVLAALDIQRRFVRERWPTALPLRVRMALHTGTASRRAGDYYGNDVNRCARLRSLAHGGQVLVSEVTARLAETELPVDATFANLGRYRLRGLNEPERVFQLKHPELAAEFPLLADAVPDSPRAAFVPSYPFPAPSRLVGRDRELKEFDNLLAEGRTRGQVALVAAGAGGGKSTLLGAVVQRAREGGFVCLAGGCYESEAAVPLRPIRDGLLDYVLSFPAEVVRSELGSTMSDLAEYLPELRHHLGLADRPADQPRPDHARLFASLHTALRYLTARSPVLLCLEDLHLADVPTLDLIHFLARQVRRLPVVLIGTYRSEEVPPGQRFSHFLSALVRDGAHTVELSRLSHDDTAQVAESVLGGPASPNLTDRVYSTSEGVPLFTEQLVLALREEQRIGQRGGVWRLIAETDGVVPTVARDVIQLRLNRLSEPCRQTLAMAAVLGQSVEHGILFSALDDRSDSDVLESLDEAVTAHILKETAAGYAFSHALLRETLYWGLSGPRRMLLHQRAGETLERGADADSTSDAAALAYHFSRSGPAQDMRRRAMKYSLQAGQIAARLSFNHDALSHFARACEILARAPALATIETRVEALVGRGVAERHLAMWQGCMTTFRDVLAATNVAVTRAHAHEAIATAYHDLGDTVAAIDEVRAGLRELDGNSDPDATAAHIQLEYVEALLHYLPGRYLAVREIGERMLRRAQAALRPDLLYRAHTVLGWSYMGQAREPEAADHYTRALAAAEEASHQLGVAITCENLGMLYLESGRFASARRNLETAIDLFRKLAREERAMNALLLLGSVYLAEGEVVQARAYGELSRSFAFETQDRWEADSHELLGRVCYLAADLDSAVAHFQSALAVHLQIDYVQGIVKSLTGLGSVHEARGDTLGARDHYERAVNIADQADVGPHTVSAHRHLGRLLRKTGDLVAIEHSQRALQAAESIRGTVEFAPALMLDAEIKADSGEIGAAYEQIERALSMPLTTATSVEAHACAATIASRMGRAEKAREHAALARECAERMDAAILLRIGPLAGFESSSVPGVSLYSWPGPANPISSAAATSFI